MKNPLTMHVESLLGLIYVISLSLFFVGVMAIEVNKFNSDAIVLDSSQVKIKTVASTERQLMAVWIKDHDISIPEGQGYRYLISQYPTRPWLSY